MIAFQKAAYVDRTRVTTYTHDQLRNPRPLWEALAQYARATLPEEINRNGMVQRLALGLGYDYVKFVLELKGEYHSETEQGESQGDEIGR